MIQGLAVASLTALAATAAVAQTAAAPTGPKFVRSGEKSDRFISPLPPPGFCDAFASPGIEFCPDKTDWKPERAHDPRLPGLYRLDDANRAAIVSIPRTYKEMQALTPGDLEELVTQYVFADGPRGPRQRMAELSREIRPSGKLLGLEAVVQDATGERFLLQLTVSLSDYSVNFSETTTALAESETPVEVTEAQRAVHRDFLGASMVSVFNDVK